MRRIASLWVVSGCLCAGVAFGQADTAPPQVPGEASAESCETDSDCEDGQRCSEDAVCEDPSEPSPVSPSDIRVGQMQGATTAPELSDAQIKWLKPRRHLMNQVPRAQTDFTAYALELGEVRVGLANITAGVLPVVRLQLATAPLLWAISVQNVQAKANPIRIGGFDMAVLASQYKIPLEDFQAELKGLGGMASLQVLEKMSIHGGLSWAQLNLSGPPSGLLPLAEKGAKSALISENGDLERFVAEIQESDEISDVLDNGEIAIEADTLVLKFAADYRFNRRDSLVLQVQAMIRGEASGNVNLPPILGLEDAISVSEAKSVTASEAFIGSLAWHSAWKRWEFRIGAGVASQPGAWLFQAMDVSYRFGGETRTSERRTRSTWRQNRGDQGKGDKGSDSP